MNKVRNLFLAIAALAAGIPASAGSWIRINQLGYIPNSTKVAVFVSNDEVQVTRFEVVDAFTGKAVFKSSQVRPMGELGELKTTCRLDFSSLGMEAAAKGKSSPEGKPAAKPLVCRVRAYSGKELAAESEVFPVGPKVYDGAADFVLNYMRQQRCGWNPFIKDSCHVHDAIIVGHPDPAKDSTHLDVIGGWHDASDCLQYTTTSANAIYQMMFAYKSNPAAFGDEYQTDGTPGRNGIPDIVDEIRWGLVWLDKMNPEPGEMYNQIADDRDHVGMRKPSEERANYGWGPGRERPVWYCSGEPQQRGRTGLKNRTTGIASTAGKFASCFALGSEVLAPFYPELAEKIGAKAQAAYDAGVAKPGNCQTASVLSPYIYEEENWTDDMELAAFELFRRTGDRKYLTEAIEYGRKEIVTPWMGADSARHYQWYPFMNMGHCHLAAQAGGKASAEFIRNVRTGIERVWERGKNHPFLYGIPGIWCSNNLTTAMLTQCILYRQMTGDTTYQEMEGALRDWLLGCNPWGVSMIVELPKGGVYPTQPHSYIPRMGLGNTTGGLVDGPVYATIFGSLLGVSMDGGINYMDVQPGDIVYHDSTHDYSTDEPTMDGTACLTFPLSWYQEEGHACEYSETPAPASYGDVLYAGGIIRTDPSRKHIDFAFTAADRADGADAIISALGKYNIKGSFFFTGEFFEKYPKVVRRLVKAGHYVGSHSYGHLLYFPWGQPDSMSVTRAEFNEDIFRSYALLRKAGIKEATVFMPPYEHYNDVVSSWARLLGLQVMNYTPGTSTNGDYTTPSMKNYYSSDFIMDKVWKCEASDPNGLNGHIMLIHLGTVPERTDKFYDRLPELIEALLAKGYTFTPLH